MTDISIMYDGAVPDKIPALIPHITRPAIKTDTDLAATMVNQPTVNGIPYKINAFRRPKYCDMVPKFNLNYN